MNQDDYEKTTSNQSDADKQTEFGSDTFDQPTRKLEPVFDDLEIIEEVTVSDSRYAADYDEDTIDYEVDPDYEEDDYDDYEEADAPADEHWHAESLEPKLDRVEERAPPFDVDPATTVEKVSGLQGRKSYYVDEEEDIIVVDDDFKWPIGLIVVAVIALALLAAGGYGVMQQRADMQEELRSLRATVASATSAEETTVNRETLQGLREENAELQNTIDSQLLEIRSLQDTASGLEGQLARLQSQAIEEAIAAENQAKAASEARSATVDAQPAADPKPAPVASIPAQAEPAAAPVEPTPTPVSAGNWFVNFSSYESKGTAEKWAKRLQTDSGKVVVVSGERNGNTFFRVRVVGLENQQQAQEVARRLEQEYKLSKLWVGRQ